MTTIERDCVVALPARRHKQAAFTLSIEDKLQNKITTLDVLANDIHHAKRIFEEMLSKAENKSQRFRLHDVREKWIPLPPFEGITLSDY